MYIYLRKKEDNISLMHAYNMVFLSSYHILFLRKKEDNIPMLLL